MKNNSLLTFALIGFLFVSCSPKIKKEGSVAIQPNICQQPIKYYVGKIRANDQEIKANIEVLINVNEKTIVLQGEDPEQGKGSKIFIIESFECDFNADLTEGIALYSGYFKEQDGTTSKNIMQVKAKNGELIISPADHLNTSNFKYIITKWEILKP